MSIQAGLWNFDDEPADRSFLQRMSQATAQHGPDGSSFFFDHSIGMLYRPFHTTEDSCGEDQPYVSPGNNVMTWDGRLDNREYLIQELDGYLTSGRTDVAIAAAAFDRWGTECFKALIGDWALVVWNPRLRILIFAKDFIGTRHLYYQQTSKRVLWCTTLESIVTMANQPLTINAEFVAGYQVSYPKAHLTPYVGIDSVSPCSYVKVNAGTHTTEKYWHFNPHNRIHCQSDSEYEELFRQVFRQSVCRRLRSQTPVIAELSGGMDSSSIVCMADMLIAERRAETCRLDTMSYFDDEEPNFNERPYFQRVEEKRNRTGFHISAVLRDRFAPLPEPYFTALPGVGKAALLFEREQDEYLERQGSRVVLSGIGGDEILGGVPSPIPELADLLGEFRWVELAIKLKAWSLARNRPWIHLLCESTWGVAHGCMRVSRSSNGLRTIPWLDSTFVKAYGESLGSVDLRTKGCLPSQRAFLSALSSLADQLALTSPPLIRTREIRYPFLDRNLCEFLFSVPREQILRPTQRRSLMRRALVDIVPPEILHRKRKAFIVRRLIARIEEAFPRLQDLFRNSLSQQLGYVRDDRFMQTLTATIHGQDSFLIPLARTVSLELWLRSVTTGKLIHPPNIREETTSLRSTQAFVAHAATSKRCIS